MRAFIDTNILIYAYDDRDIEKQQIARELLRDTVADGQAVISTQVVQEFCNVVLKKFSKTDLPGLRKVIDKTFGLSLEHTPDEAFYNRALLLFEKNSISFYDVLIVQAAIDLRCDVLYSEDLQTERTIEGVAIVNPFLMAGASRGFDDVDDFLAELKS
jgi:predicted nucleic acid-binding protein